MFRNAMRIFTGAAILAAAATAWADIIILNNNSMFAGEHVTILTITDDVVIIEYINDGIPIPLSMRRADVVRVVRSEDQRRDGEISFAPEQPVIPEDMETIYPDPDMEQIPLGATPFPEWRDPPAQLPLQDIQDVQDSAAPLLPVVTPQGQVYTVVGVGVSFREGPDQRYPSIMRLLSGELLLEIERREDWLYVSTVTPSPRRGWVPIAQVRPMQNIPCLVISERANLRETPDDTSLRLGALNEGSVVIQLDERGGWSQVLRDSTTAGWVRSDTLEPLQDIGVLQPTASVRGNQDAGQPIRVERQRNAFGETRLTFTVRDRNFVRDDLIKLIAFHRDRATGQAASTLFSGGDILSRERIDSSMGLVEAGIPDQVAASFHGADIFTLVGRDVGEGWVFELTVPEQAAITYAMMQQRGPDRGMLIVIDTIFSVSDNR